MIIFLYKGEEEEGEQQLALKKAPEKKAVAEKSDKFKDFYASNRITLDGMMNGLKKEDPNITKAFLKKVITLIWLSSENDKSAVEGTKRLFSIATVKSIASMFGKLKLAPSRK
jgi:hypothetical protein